MPKITKITLTFLAEFILIFSFWVLLPTLLIDERNGTQHLGEINILPLDINHSHLQSFIADQDNLSSVSLQLKNPEIKSIDNVYLQIENDKKEIVCDMSVNGRNIADPSWINFNFIPIRSKKGDHFYLKIRSDAPKDNLLYIYGNDQNSNLNFKSSYKTLSLKEAFGKNLEMQKNRIYQMDKIYLSFYLILISIVNFLLFL